MDTLQDLERLNGGLELTRDLLDIAHRQRLATKALLDAIEGTDVPLAHVASMHDVTSDLLSLTGRMHDYIGV